jgi:hypothetical protein
MLFEYRTNPKGLCGSFGDRDQVQRLLAAHDSGASDNNLELWTLLAAEVWYQDVFRGRTSAALSADRVASFPTNV